MTENATLAADGTGDVADRIARASLADRGESYRSEVRRLLDAAVDVMRRCGTTSRPRVADIVAAAGLSNDAFYRHFRSKDALVAAILEDGAERLRSYLAHQMAKESTPGGRVRRWVEGVMSQAADDDIASTTLAVLWNGSSLGEGFTAAPPSASGPLATLLVEPFAELGSADAELDASLAAHAAVGKLSDFLWARVRPTPADVEHLTGFCLRASHAAVKAVRGAGGGVAVVDVDTPPGVGELLDIKAASICSSDFLYLRFGSEQVIGHELAGVRADGTPVTVEAIYGCNECEQCRRGDFNLCPTHPQRALGISADGGMAEQFLAPPERLVPVPAGLSVRDASLVEPASVSWHALRLGGTGPETRVAVVGAGALGLLAVSGARRQGATDVAIEARHPHQQVAAERLGARIGPEGLYDVVVEAAGTPASLARSIELVAPGGSVVVVGVYPGPVEVDWMTLFQREGRLVPSLGYCHHDDRREMEDAAAMLAADKDIAGALITHRFPLVEADEAFRVAGDRAAGAIRVVLEP